MDLSSIAIIIAAMDWATAAVIISAIIGIAPIILACINIWAGGNKDKKKSNGLDTNYTDLQVVKNSLQHLTESLNEVKHKVDTLESMTREEYKKLHDIVTEAIRTL